MYYNPSMDFIFSTMLGIFFLVFFYIFFFQTNRVISYSIGVCKKYYKNFEGVPVIGCTIDFNLKILESRYVKYIYKILSLLILIFGLLAIFDYSI